MAWTDLGFVVVAVLVALAIWEGVEAAADALWRYLRNRR